MKYVVSCLMLLLLFGCAPTDAQSQLFKQAEEGWIDAGYRLILTKEEPPIVFPAPHRHYKVDNDHLVMYIFDSAEKANQAKLDAEKPNPKWDYLIPIYMVKDNVLFIYFTSAAQAKPPLFDKLEKVVEGIDLQKDIK
ncbi:hypothetical protein MUG87_11010 [Ectobacillus sp. JY-23]|uniref:hypothetical protein n=1 Tax=Ectobacillus sp. JY-23 TaxID=2933872 RepID=UPI001FF2A566|nr:hypothetical protein [Ectobacillus sp. JY-23]UOY91097.1 hypothetical protein MUG87_11010 [Ectobacillus sp. JY-23]